MNWAGKQLLLAVFAFMLTILFFESSEFDLWVQDLFFNFDNNTWIVSRDNPIAKFLFYDGVKQFYITFALGLVVFLVFFYKSKLVKERRAGFIVVCASVFLVPLLISSLKSVTNVPCPKDIVHYGGDYPYVTITTFYPDDFVQDRVIKCYPAGHASGGFALMSLFLLFHTRQSKTAALVGSVSLGWIVGSYKMLIGDHFLSHTIVTMLLAWIIILVLHMAVIQYEAKIKQDDSG